MCGRCPYYYTSGCNDHPSCHWEGGSECWGDRNDPDAVAVKVTLELTRAEVNALRNSFCIVETDENCIKNLVWEFLHGEMEKNRDPQPI